MVNKPIIYDENSTRKAAKFSGSSNEVTIDKCDSVVEMNTITLDLGEVKRLLKDCKSMEAVVAESTTKIDFWA
jgi:hypothetical protein